MKKATYDTAMGYIDKVIEVANDIAEKVGHVSFEDFAKNSLREGIEEEIRELKVKLKVVELSKRTCAGTDDYELLHLQHKIMLKYVEVLTIRATNLV